MVGASFSSVYAGIPWDTDDIADDAITSEKIKDKQVKSRDIKGNAIKSGKIKDGTILFSDISQNSCASNQIMKWNGASWVCAQDIDTIGATGMTGMTGPLSFPIYRVTKDLGFINPGDQNFNGVATCKAGDQLISGGYAVGGTAYVRISQPFGASSWEIWAVNPMETITSVTVIAICLDLP